MPPYPSGGTKERTRRVQRRMQQSRPPTLSGRPSGQGCGGPRAPRVVLTTARARKKSQEEVRLLSRAPPTWRSTPAARGAFVTSSQSYETARRPQWPTRGLLHVPVGVAPQVPLEAARERLKARSQPASAPPPPLVVVAMGETHVARRGAAPRATRGRPAPASRVPPRPPQRNCWALFGLAPNVVVETVPVQAAIARSSRAGAVGTGRAPTSRLPAMCRASFLATPASRSARSRSAWRRGSRASRPTGRSGR